jgi:hypothetical protein
MFKNILLVCAGFDIIAIIVVLSLQNNLPPIVPLLYGLPVGNEQLVPVIGLTIPALVSLATICLNFIIVKLLKDKFLEKILAGISILTTLLALTTIVNIFLTVGKI